MRKIAIFLIKIYRLLLSPLLGRNCRFYPTCSAYTSEAIKKYGIFKGILLGGKRLLKCHPFHPGGVDLVP